MVQNLRTLLLETKALSESSRGLLTKWLVENTTGNDRLRAGLPNAWRVGDKTGTGPDGATNDVAIAWPPNRAPVLIAVYSWGSKAPQADLNRAHADIARAIAG
jgi:beta-lactamase class A